VNALYPVFLCLLTAPSPDLEGLPFRLEIREPVFRSLTVSIASYGASGDGLTMNTAAFAKAIAFCAGQGGGTVDVPPGIWLTGPIRLMSNIRLSVAKGAVILFSHRFEDYPLIPGPDATSRGFRCVPCLYGYRLDNVAITGGGSIDGQGEFWRPVKKEKLTPARWQALVASGGALSADSTTWFPSRGAMEGEAYLKTLPRSSGAGQYSRAREFLRPVMIQLVDCRSVLIDGPALTNSPSFHLQPLECEDVVIRNLTVTAEWNAQNADGIDISSCRRVLVHDCTVNVGDDAICIKPGKISPRQAPGPACQSIAVMDCTVYHGHGGFVIGSQTYGGARDIAVRNCVFHGTDVGLRFKSARGKGGLIENVDIDGVRMTSIAGEAVLFDMLYASGSGTASTGDPDAGSGGEHMPEFRGVQIRNVVCAGAGCAVRILGLPGAPLRGVTFDALTIAAASGVFCSDAEGVTFRNVRVDPSGGPRMTFRRSRGVTVNGAAVSDSAEVWK